MLLVTCYYLMPSLHRTQKLEGLIKEQLSKIIDRDMDFPAGSLVTVTRAFLSSDGHYATAYLSVLSPEPERIVKTLRKHIYEIQQSLNKQMRIRPVPKIRFALDEQEFKREKIEKSLSELKRKGEI